MFIPPATATADAMYPLLRGHGVVLEPLTISHTAELFTAARPEMFDHFLTWPQVWTEKSFAAWIGPLLANPKNAPFAIRENGALNGSAGLSSNAKSPWSGRLVGASSYCDIDPANRAVEIGWTWYTPDAQSTRINPACKLLLLEHAFTKLGCVRVQLKCDLRNTRSQAAITKLGATREGVLHQHRIQQNGFIRDTVMYSITAAEWPAVKRGLQTRLPAV